ncbi:MAG TPA: hypothetical protein VGM23_01610, partial [Armatimonadota bacterium]
MRHLLTHPRWLLVLCVLALAPCLAQTAPAKNPSVLIINGHAANPTVLGDFTWFKQLNQHGMQLDVHFLNMRPERPLNWDLIKQYNCLVFLDFPLEEQVAKTTTRAYAWKSPPYRQELMALLDRYLQEGGGVFVMPNLHGYAEAAACINNMDESMQHWGAHLPLEVLHDPATETVHPRNGIPFLYTKKIAPSPVSEEVNAIWFPVAPVSTWSYQLGGQPIDVSRDWTVVVRGSDTSFTADPVIDQKSAEADLAKTMYRRPNQQTPPSLFAIRTVGDGRMALTVLWPIYTLHGGTSWIHDGVVLDKGQAGRPSDFGRLFENTVRWLSEPSLQSGKLGGYIQDPNQ